MPLIFWVVAGVTALSWLNALRQVWINRPGDTERDINFAVEGGDKKIRNAFFLASIASLATIVTALVFAP